MQSNSAVEATPFSYREDRHTTPTDARHSAFLASDSISRQALHLAELIAQCPFLPASLRSRWHASLSRISIAQRKTALAELYQLIEAFWQDLPEYRPDGTRPRAEFYSTLAQIQASLSRLETQLLRPS